MDAKFLAKTLGGLTIGVTSFLLTFACNSGDESLGSDSNASEHGKGGSTSNTDPTCETIECFRAVECVEQCGGPVVQASCCACPDGLLDSLVDCPSGGGNEGGASSGGSGGTVSMGGHSAAGTPGNGEGGYAQGGVGGESGTVEPDLTQLHANCDGGTCPTGLTAMEYYGFAGPSGPLFCSCEIPCEEDPNVCPATTTCAVISDGPGAVCMAQ